MKASELRDMDREALQEELLRLRKEQFGLRMQRGSEHLPQTHLLKETRRDIARVKTCLRERAEGVLAAPATDQPAEERDGD